MSLSRIEELQRAAEAAPSAEAYEQLVQAEIAYVAGQRRRVLEAEAHRAAATQRKRELEAALHAAAEAGVGETSDAAPLRTLDAQECAAYKQEWLRLLKEFVTRKDVLTHLLAYSVADLRLADLTLVSRWLDTWGSFLSGADAAVRALKATERGSRNAPELPPTRELYDALDEVCRLQLQARSLVGRERYRRSASSPEAIEDLKDSQAQLVEWCRAQQATLAPLRSVTDLAEFSASLAANVPVMTSNFLILMEQSEPVAEQERVLEALKSANQAWTELSLQAYDKLRAAVVAEHATSGLEVQCLGWLSEAAGRVPEYLSAVHDALQAERARHTESSAADDEAQRRDAARALELCATSERLLRECAAHKTLCTHLSNFTIRERCVRPHYEALKHELRSAVTATVMSFPAEADYETKVEYKNRMKELREWIDVKSQKGTYLKLLERLDATKKMIEEYADALFPDEDTDSAAPMQAP